MHLNNQLKNWILFKIFFLAGTFTFAGGIAMLPIIEKDVVDKYKMIERTEFLDYVTLAQTLPGVISLTCACLVGKKCNGTKGMIYASLGTILPAYILMLIATIFYNFIPQDGPIQYAFLGIRACSIATILSAAITLGKYHLQDKYSWIIMIISFLLIVIVNIQAPYVIVGTGLFGIFYHSYLKRS